MVDIDVDVADDDDGNDDDNELVNSLLDVALSFSQTLQSLWVLQSLEHIQNLKSKR